MLYWYEKSAVWATPYGTLRRSRASCHPDERSEEGSRRLVRTISFTPLVCYLLVPSEKALSSDARKRLAAIQEFAGLGAGFRIAARDLEIRGSGNILGGEQSGQIAAAGFEMYCKLLEEAIAELRGEVIEELVETSMSLGINIYIPRDYVADENLRMMFYKKIASARDEARLGEIRAEMRDRFGAVPDDVDRLLDFVRLKLRAQKIGVQSVAREGRQIALRFMAGAKIDPNRLLLLLGEMPRAKFPPSGVLSFATAETGAALIGAIGEVLGRLARSCVTVYGYFTCSTLPVM